jgi:hypothetical protein
MAMKRILLTSLMVLSVLGNIVTVGAVGYWYLKPSPVIKNIKNDVFAAESAATDGEVLDVISIDEDGYKSRYLIVQNKGQRVVVQDYSQFAQGKAPVNVGQSIKIKPIKVASGSFLFVQYMQVQ